MTSQAVAEPVLEGASLEVEQPRARRGRSARRFLQLLHELEADTTWSLNKRNASGAERPADRARSPEDSMARQLGVEIVHEERRVQKPFIRQLACVLVDGLREERQGKYAELHVSPAPVHPRDSLCHGRTGRLVPGARLLQIGDLDGQVGQAGDGHQCNGVPYSEPRSSAMSSRRTPSGSEKYNELSLSICVGIPATSSRARAASHCAWATEMATWWSPPSTSA